MTQPQLRPLLRAFADSAWIVVRHADEGKRVHHPNLRPVQQPIWDLSDLSLPSASPY